MIYNILLIEDEQIIAQNIKTYIETQEQQYQVDIAFSGEDGLHQFTTQTYQLVLLDLMLPNMSGSDVLREIRIQSDVPVIVISALTDELIQSDLYNLQVDDYVTKPFSLKILAHKIKVLCRRIYGEKMDKITYKRITIIPHNYEVYDEEKQLSVTKKEFEILQLLMMNKGRIFTREQLLSKLWDDDKDVSVITVHIGNLRRKLPQDIIQTVQGIGYKIGEYDEKE